MWLCGQTKGASTQPPKPLILAASGESNDAKHHRLIEQLRFAWHHGLESEAISRLRKIPLENWNHGPLNDWHTWNY